MRRTFASYGLAQGHSLELIGQLLGHTQAQTSKRYARLMTDVGSAAALATGEPLARLIEGQASGRPMVGSLPPTREPVELAD